MTLEERVTAYKCFELPGQPMAVHMGTSYLISDLMKEVEALRVDAERYRWLREQHWNDSIMCVAMNPKTALTLGANCPSLDLLDAAIDTAMEKTK